jgi:flagellar L-ring protein precursor FlgH
MRKIFFLLIAGTMLLIGKDAVYSQFIQNSSRSLFSDVKAFKVGDAIMVLIMEDTQVDNGASTSETRSTDLSGGVVAGGGNTSFKGDAGINTGNQFKAQGANSRKEKLRSRLSARVLEVDENNGNLKIEGTRTTKVNGETQTIVIRGIVRQVDVQPNNSVYSYNVLDLALSIDGKGNLSETQEPGWITRFLRILF